MLVIKIKRSDSNREVSVSMLNSYIILINKDGFSRKLQCEFGT